MPSLNQNVKKSHHKLRRRRRTRNKIKGGTLRLPRLAALRQSTPIVAEEDARGMAETMHLYLSITGDWVFRAFVHSDSPGCKAYRKRLGLPTDILPLGRFNWIFMQSAGTYNIEIELILEQDLENLPGVKAGLPITISQVTDNVKIIDIINI